MTMGRALMIVVGGAIAVVGAALAVFGPGAWWDLVLARLIGSGGDANTTAAQRVIAAAGAVVAGVALARWGDVSRAVRPLRMRWRLWLACVPFVVLLVHNLRYAGAGLGLWGWPRPVPFGVLTAVAGLLVIACVVVIAWRDNGGAAAARPLWLATGCGVGYGGFSALWHCCPPLWELTAWPGSMLGSAIWLSALTLSLGAIGRVAARWPAPQGELAGAVAFACFYPWHTPAWFAQCLVAGAFSTWMVRLTGSGWAPAVFLGTAYATHMTLPFLGWVGAAIAWALVLAHYAVGVPRESR